MLSKGFKLRFNCALSPVSLSSGEKAFFNSFIVSTAVYLTWPTVGIEWIYEEVLVLSAEKCKIYHIISCYINRLHVYSNPINTEVTIDDIMDGELCSLIVYYYLDHYKEDQWHFSVWRGSEMKLFPRNLMPYYQETPRRVPENVFPLTVNAQHTDIVTFLKIGMLAYYL